MFSVIVHLSHSVGTGIDRASQADAEEQEHRANRADAVTALSTCLLLMLSQLRAANYQLDLDLKDKGDASSIDFGCISLNTTSKGLSFFPNATRSDTA
jgi:hypothetical protein